MSSNNPVNLYEKFFNLQYVSPGYKISWISVKLKKVNKTKTERCFCLRLRLQRKRHELCACFSFSQLGFLSTIREEKRSFFLDHLKIIPQRISFSSRISQGGIFHWFCKHQKIFQISTITKGAWKFKTNTI